MSSRIFYGDTPIGVIPEGNQDIDTLSEVDVTSKATARISEAERAKIIPENIKKDVTILGKTGTFEGSGGGVSVGAGYTYRLHGFGECYVDWLILGTYNGVYGWHYWEASTSGGNKIDGVETGSNDTTITNASMFVVIKSVYAHDGDIGAEGMYLADGTSFTTSASAEHKLGFFTADVDNEIQD